jgi:hypothetical protein
VVAVPPIVRGDTVEAGAPITRAVYQVVDVLVAVLLEHGVPSSGIT